MVVLHWLRDIHLLVRIAGATYIFWVCLSHFGRGGSSFRVV